MLEVMIIRIAKKDIMSIRTLLLLLTFLPLVPPLLTTIKKG